MSGRGPEVVDSGGAGRPVGASALGSVRVGACRVVGSGRIGAWSSSDSPPGGPGVPLIAAARDQSANVEARHFPG